MTRNAIWNLTTNTSTSFTSVPITFRKKYGTFSVLEKPTKTTPLMPALLTTIPSIWSVVKTLKASRTRSRQVWLTRRSSHSNRHPKAISYSSHWLFKRIPVPGRWTSSWASPSNVYWSKVPTIQVVKLHTTSRRPRLKKQLTIRIKAWTYNRTWS